MSGREVGWSRLTDGEVGVVGSSDRVLVNPLLEALLLEFRCSTGCAIPGLDGATRAGVLFVWSRLVFIVLEGNATLFLRGVKLGLELLVVICGELDGDNEVEGVASNGEGNGLGACSDGMLTDSSLRFDADAIDPTRPRTLTNGASKHTLTR